MGALHPGGEIQLIGIFMHQKLKKDFWGGERDVGLICVDGG